MLTANYNVSETEYGLSFDENFDPTCFAIHFQLDPEDDISPSGWVTFEPRKGAATLCYYGHPEDLSASIRDYSLRDSVLGREVLINFNEYKIGDLYRAAKAYTTHVVLAYEAELKRIWHECIKEWA